MRIQTPTPDHGTIFNVLADQHHAQVHAAGHVAAADLIDGDHLDITFTPAQYTPSAAPAEAADVNDLAAHLQGIDDELGLPGKFYDSLYPNTSPVSSVSANTFGSWVQISGDIGTSRRLYYIYLVASGSIASFTSVEVEVGVGSAASEVAVARGATVDELESGVGRMPPTLIPVMVDLADNVRVSVRVRDEDAAARTHRVLVYVGAQ